jgi:hypothetical protein
MKYVLSLAVAFALLPRRMFPYIQQLIHEIEIKRHPHLVRFQIVNMSGKSREAHVGDIVITLPVAQPVALQVLPGHCIEVSSKTSRNLNRLITVTALDEGRIIPVD